MEMAIDFSDSFCRSDHHELGESSINGIYYLSVDNMLKTASQ